MKKYILPVAIFFLLAACSKQDDTAEPAQSLTGEAQQSLAPGRHFSMESLSRGAAVFQQYCAECHGPQGQGHPGWVADDNNGLVLAPPLDGTGNSWKRSRQEMITAIKRGVKRDKTPVMPGWQGRLKDQEIEDTISWLQALWPTEVYETWQKANAGEVAASGGS